MPPGDSFITNDTFRFYRGITGRALALSSLSVKGETEKDEHEILISRRKRKTLKYGVPRSRIMTQRIIPER